MKRRIRQLTRRNQGRSWHEIKARLEVYIRGWVNYYALADAMSHTTRLDEWLRRRMRQLAWKQWKTPKNRISKSAKARRVRILGATCRRVESGTLAAINVSPQYNKLSVMPTGRRRAYPASKHNINFVTLDRTAGCGPACPVVWEGGRLPAPPIPIVEILIWQPDAAVSVGWLC